MNVRCMLAAATVLLCACTAGLEAQDTTGAKPAAASGLPATPMPQTPDYKAPKVPEPVLNEKGAVVLEPPVPEPAAGDALFAPLAVAGPDTFARKFKDYTYLTWGPRALISPLIPAAIKQARPNTNYPEDWQTGAGAFGRNYGSSVATKATGTTARFAVGAALHEDFRYRPTWGKFMAGGSAGAGERHHRSAMVLPKSDKNVPERILYAIGFTFVDRSDSGHLRPAMANLSSAAASGFVGNAFLPDGFNDTDHGLTRMGSRFGSMVFQNVTREFSPEIEGVAQKLHIPFPRLPIPEWWVPRSKTPKAP